MIKSILIILIALTTITVQAQNADTIFFHKNYTSLSTGGSIIPVYKYINDTIFYRSNPYPIIIYDKLDTSDLAFCFIYFKGWKNSPIPKISPLLISGITKSLTSIYVDKNNNLDFTDDGSPLILNKLNDSITISLSNSNNPLALYNLKLKFAHYKDEETKDRVLAFFKNHKNGKGNKLVESKYWFSDTRKNFLITEDILNGDSIKIGIQDYNCNGFYNDIKDRILIGNYKTDFISDLKSKGAYNYKDTTVVKINNNYYEVKEIEETGSFVVLNHTELRSNKLEVGDIVPDMSVKLLDGSFKQLHSILDSERYNLIDIWGTWCEGCVLQTSDLLELSSRYSTSLKIIALNYGDSDEKIKSYLSDNNISWLNGYASKDIRSTLLVDSYPYLLLLDKNNKVILIQTDINELEKILLLNK